MESSGSSGGISAEATVLGILSDTHGRADAAAAGIATLRAAGAQFLIHCGDIGGESVLDLLAGIPSVFVWGNCDFDRAGMVDYAKEIGIQCAGDFAELQFSGKQIAVTHGDNPRLLRQIMERDPPYDYLFLGHTHIAADEHRGRLRIVNPGALHRTARKTVALVDLNADAIRHLAVPM
jgi:hypothetical protein